MVAFFAFAHVIALIASVVIIYVGLRYLWERHRPDFWVVLAANCFILGTSFAFIFGLISH